MRHKNQQGRDVYSEENERNWRRKMLLDLVNLPDDGAGWFRRHWSYALPKDDQKLMEYRHQLRRFWSGEAGTDWALVIWLNESNKLDPFEVRLLAGYFGVVPRYSIFPLSLAVGATELGRKMAVCANPECPNPYFLRARPKQRFCDRPACAEYGQREHKRTWWRVHGKEWKEKRECEKKGRRHAKGKKT